MFTKSAKFYDAIYQFKDYAGAAKQLQALIQEYNSNARTLIDVGCGTGKHLEYLREYYQVEGLDLDGELLNVGRERCPEVPFHQGNMVNFNLDRKFDVVTCLFSAIAYVQTIECLEEAIATMTRHLEPGGIMVVEPWVSPENYWRNKIVANFVDEPDLKISWMYSHEIEDFVSVFNINYLVGTPQGVAYFTEQHKMGLFTQEQYLEACQKSGLKVDYDPKGLFGRGMYIAVKNSIS